MNLPALRRTLWVCLWLPACARSTPGAVADAGPGDDAGVIDASATDAMVAQVPHPGTEVVAAGGQVRAGTRTMDVALGHWVEQRELSAGSRRLVGAAVVYP